MKKILRVGVVVVGIAAVLYVGLENGKAWTVKVQASYEKLYETSAEVKADLLKAAVVDPTLAFAKYESN